jgi:hypothetical protein
MNIGLAFLLEPNNVSIVRVQYTSFSGFGVSHFLNLQVSRTQVK